MGEAGDHRLHFCTLTQLRDHMPCFHSVFATKAEAARMGISLSQHRQAGLVHHPDLPGPHTWVPHWSFASVSMAKSFDCFTFQIVI